MTNEELQAKLPEAEAEIKNLQVFKQLVEARGESDRMIMSMIHQYECKICHLLHFPEPLTKCEREKDNKEKLAREKRQRQRYFNEFKAAVKRCTDERGKVNWHLVESSDERVWLTTRKRGRNGN